MPSLQKGGLFQWQPWKIAGQGVTFAPGCVPAGIQEPPPPTFGNAKKEKIVRNQVSPELSTAPRRCRSLPGRVASHQ